MFKVGDEVTIFDKLYGHGFDVGAVVTIVRVIDNDSAIVPYYVRNDKGEYWWLCDREIKSAKKEAEREKDPFAPGKWVVCVERDRPLKIGSVIQVYAAHASYPKDWFVVNIEGTRWGMRKSHFRPATPEEIKEQEMKIMDEKKADEARANRQTFTVGGQEFYVGQTVWAEKDGFSFSKADELEVIGPVNDAPFALCVRKPSSSMIYFAGHDAITTTKPKPHEWKFGDWARHKDGHLGMVISYEHNDGNVWFLRKGSVDGKLTHTTLLTYISTAEIPA